MDDLRGIARRLGGEVSSGAIICPGPGHSPSDRSLRVFRDWQSPTGFRVHSFAGDSWEDCQDHICRLMGIERRNGERDAPWPVPVRANKPAAKDDHNKDLAIEIFAAASPVAGSIAATYLEKRIGRAIPWPTDLRFHPKCPRGDRKLPALVALLRDIHTDQPRAIQRVFLESDGSDRIRDAMGKATLGPAAGAACKLSPNDAVTQGLGIIEGIEKGLALLAVGWAPVWVTCGTSGMSAFPLLAGIEMLTAFSDNDAPGQKAAMACARRWAAGGKRARIITPRQSGSDWSDALRAAA